MAVHTPESIVKLVKDEGIEAIWHWFVDLEGAIKGFAITPTELERSLEDGMHFDGSSISGFNAIEESDLVAHPDLSTFAILPGHAGEVKSARFFCDIQHPDGTPYERDPRYVLRKTVEKAEAMGFDPYMGPELEFFLFKSKKRPIPIDSGGYFTGPPIDRGNNIRTDIIKELNQLGIIVEYQHHEVAAGQQEIDLRYNKVLQMADDGITYKYVVKNVAERHGKYATFMPKPIFGVNGSGMHVHQSLFKKGTGTNAFADPKDANGLSDIAKQYIAGTLKYAHELTCFWNPTVNSFKRLVPGYEAPVYIAWSANNRSALVRIPAFTKGREKSVRMELRCPDPSANLYLAFATMLGAGLKGIEEKLDINEPQVDNLYDLSELEREERRIKSLPGNLHEALHHCKRGSLAKEILGESMVNNFLALKYAEYDEYRVQVTKWELDRYLAVL